MSRGILRTLLAGLALALVLALAVPTRGEAAGARDRASGWSLASFLPHWLIDFLAKSALQIDPNGSNAPTAPGGKPDSALQIDPDG